MPRLGAPIGIVMDMTAQRRARAIFMRRIGSVRGGREGIVVAERHAHACAGHGKALNRHGNHDQPCQEHSGVFCYHRSKNSSEPV